MLQGKDCLAIKDSQKAARAICSVQASQQHMWRAQSCLYTDSRSFMCLQADNCLALNEEDDSIESLTPGRICSQYYLKHQSLGVFAQELGPDMDLKQVSTCEASFRWAGVRW